MASFRFERFILDPQDRRLLRDGVPVELNARYLDALALLVGERGRLVPKERFLEEVWRGVPVTDEALTQCIRTLRKQLGDDAASPRFIETVPKYGYRFIARVGPIEAEASSPAAFDQPSKHLLLFGSAGTLGGGAAGAVGGLLYGFAGASQPQQAGVGAISVLLVIWVVTVLIALVGAAGVAFGMSAAGVVSRRPGPWTVFGGALGGLAVGAVVKLLGLDAFNLLFGHSPGDITGALEGAVLGGGVGLGAWLGDLGRGGFRQRLFAGGACGAAAGVAVSLIGGRLMGGSLDLLASGFPDSRLSLAPIGALFGETGLGPASLTVTAALEGFVFGVGIVGGMVLARRFSQAAPTS